MKKEARRYPRAPFAPFYARSTKNSNNSPPFFPPNPAVLRPPQAATTVAKSFDEIAFNTPRSSWQGLYSTRVQPRFVFRSRSTVRRSASARASFFLRNHRQLASRGFSQDGATQHPSPLAAASSSESTNRTTSRSPFFHCLQPQRPTNAAPPTATAATFTSKTLSRIALHFTFYVFLIEHVVNNFAPVRFNKLFANRPGKTPFDRARKGRLEKFAVANRRDVKRDRTLSRRENDFVRNVKLRREKSQREPVLLL